MYIPIGLRLQLRDEKVLPYLDYLYFHILNQLDYIFIKINDGGFIISRKNEEKN